MTDLNAKQRAFLRKLAHHEKPIVHIGNEGVTDSVLRAVEDAFNTRELIKARVLEAAPEDVRVTAGQVAAGVAQVAVVQTIGRTAVLYRPDPEAPTIKLPRPKSG